MAGEVNTFKTWLKLACVLAVVSIVLQIAGLSTDHLQSITFIVKQHWGLWNYCYEIPTRASKCYSLVTSDKYVTGIIANPSLWRLFQAVHVVGLMFLVAAFLLIIPQLFCRRYNRKSLVAAVTLSTIAGLLILIGCSVYAGIKRAFYRNIVNSQLEYSFYLLVAAGVMAIISAIIINVARRNFPNVQTRPAGDSIGPHHARNQDTTSSDSIGPHHARNHDTQAHAVISYQIPPRELQHSAYGDRRAYHVTKQNAQPQPYITDRSIQERW